MRTSNRGKNRDLIKWLSGYRSLVEEQLQMYDEYKMMEARAFGLSSPRLSGMPKGSGAGDPGDAYVRLMEQARLIGDLGDEATRKSREIIDALNSVEDPEQRLLLECRYLRGYDWMKVSQVLHVSIREVYRLHGRALQKVESWHSMTV